MARRYFHRSSAPLRCQKRPKRFPHVRRRYTSTGQRRLHGRCPSCSEHKFKIHVSSEESLIQKRARVVVNEERQIHATFGITGFHQSQGREGVRHSLTYFDHNKDGGREVVVKGEENLTATSTGGATSTRDALIAQV